jgi:hypothetical protein
VTDVQNANLQALDEIEDLLVAYAAARLSPAGPVLARMRAHALAQADVLAGQRAVAAAVVAIDERERRIWAPSLQLRRRALTLAAAATLTLASGAAVLAAPPGSPFFQARVAIQSALLPSQADARLHSRELHLDEWLVAAEAAASRGDVVALDAVLAAYQAEVDIAVAELGSDPALLARLEEILGRHVTTLTALEARLPDEAAVGDALQSSQKAVENIKDKKSPAGRPTAVPHGPEDVPAGR